MGNSPGLLALAAAALATAGILPPSGSAYVIGGGWPDGTIEMKLMLDAPGEGPSLPTGGLADGSTSWNAAILPALADWNAQMKRTQLSSTAEATLTTGRGNDRNEIFFASTIYGEPFGDRTLAVTLQRPASISGMRFTEADIVFNTDQTWDSYRGNRRQNFDIRRVALHELGHVIGLDHPDEASPAQTVDAIMNSLIGNRDTLAADDIAAVAELYPVFLKRPVITKNLIPLTLIEGGGRGRRLVVGVDGVLAPPETNLRKYAWTFRPTGGALEPLFTITDGFIDFGTAQLDDVGSYAVAIETPQGEFRSNSVSVAVSPVSPSPFNRLANLSTRGLAGDGDRALIVGFVIGGDEPRRILLRGIGPTLTNALYTVPNAVGDTTLALTDSGGTEIASNDNWDGDLAEANALLDAFAQAGAFPLDAGAGDSALLRELQPGVYTALVTPNNGTEGIALVEAYDLDSKAPGGNRLVNLSTRGFVSNDDEILIAGFVVTGTGPRVYLLRAVGDSLGDQGVQGFLDDTTLELYDSTGLLLRKTDDWDSPEFLQPKLTDTFRAVGALPFVDRQESAMLLTLNPGSYTLHLAGFEDRTGIALVEIYEVDS